MRAVGSVAGGLLSLAEAETAAPLDLYKREAALTSEKPLGMNPVA